MTPGDYSNNLFEPLEKRKIRNFKIRIKQSLNFGRTQNPYLSGDSFAALADFVFTPQSNFSRVSVKRAKQARSVFVKSHELEFLDFDLFPSLKVLIAGNSDRNFDVLPPLSKVPQLLLLQNSSIVSDIVRTLPIGLENRSLGRFHGKKDFHFDPNRVVIDNRVLVPPMSNTNPIRPLMIEHAMKLKSEFDVKVGYLSESNYLDLIKRYQFLLCLEGNGYENHRIWECLYLGIFPVMLETEWSRTLKRLSLPILFVKNLEEIDRNLLDEYARSHRGFNPALSESLWIPYWRNLIQRFTESL